LLGVTGTPLSFHLVVGPHTMIWDRYEVRDDHDVALDEDNAT
jgi:hypothetical protein